MEISPEYTFFSILEILKEEKGGGGGGRKWTRVCSVHE